MAHTRKDTLVAPPEWWRHLRPYNKRRVAKKERRAANRRIRDSAGETAGGGGDWTPVGIPTNFTPWQP